MVIEYSRAVQPIQTGPPAGKSVIRIGTSATQSSDDSSSNSDDSASDSENEVRHLCAEPKARAVATKTVNLKAKPEGPLLMVRERHRYLYTRTWRGYLVPEDVEK
jgi:hypothetical protein